jgi:hypothetical protein
MATTAVVVDDFGDRDVKIIYNIIATCKKIFRRKVLGTLP